MFPMIGRCFMGLLTILEQNLDCSLFKKIIDQPCFQLSIYYENNCILRWIQLTHQWLAKKFTLHYRQCVQFFLWSILGPFYRFIKQILNFCPHQNTNNLDHAASKTPSEKQNSHPLVFWMYPLTIVYRLCGYS